MDLRKLEIFVRVAQHKNFSAAARSLHMAQPAVSIAVRKLEQSLNAQLLDRSGKQVELTAEGHILMTRAQAILRDVDSLTEAVGDMNALLSGELTIACPSMLATYFMPNLLTGFLTEHPGLSASVTQAGTAQIEHMLKQGDIEIGVTTAELPQEDDELERIPLINEQMVLCVPRGHPWQTRAHIDIRELDQSPMVVYESGYFIRSTLDQLCTQWQVQPELRMQTNFLPLLIKMVKEGLGTTVGLKIMADEEPDIIGIDLHPPTQIRMALAKRRGRTVSRANQAFLDWAAFKL